MKAAHWVFAFLFAPVKLAEQLIFRVEKVTLISNI